MRVLESGLRKSRVVVLPMEKSGWGLIDGGGKLV